MIEGQRGRSFALGLRGRKKRPVMRNDFIHRTHRTAPSRLVALVSQNVLRYNNRVLRLPAIVF